MLRIEVINVEMDLCVAVAIIAQLERRSLATAPVEWIIPQLPYLLVPLFSITMAHQLAVITIGWLKVSVL